MLSMDEIKIKVSGSQLTAAHALNLCMVSVSQIVDYQDLVIMEQDYEGILNNLNLENISKDKALLDVLKQILDVITFFRIQEGDRKLIEREYRQKMKNALWSAIPSPTMLVTTSAVGLGLSLATMVGTGYMNYRRAKAENRLSYERERWQLQRSAIEQLNGLRRELFSAAWQFADHYEYPDELRLTERQIRHYNDILMDANLIRKYQRLEAIQEYFFAYPPFWYEIGSAANEIYRMSDPKLYLSDGSISERYSNVEVRPLEIRLDDTSREKYRKDAARYYELYWEINKSPLLREDPTAAACALEYADLLIADHADQSKILALIDNAVRFAGSSFDVLQLCAIAYLQLGATDKAIRILKILVNEEYNTELNAQLLSAQYIALYVDGDENARINARAEYSLLVSRMSPAKNEYLMPWPEKNKIDEQGFIAQQREMVAGKYKVLLKEIEDAYTVKFERLLPGPDPYVEYDDSYFAEKNRKRRLSDIYKVFNIQEKKVAYVSAAQNMRVAFDYIELNNEMFSMISEIKPVSGDCMQEIIQRERAALLENGSKIYTIQNNITEGEMSLEDYRALDAFFCSESRAWVFRRLGEEIDRSFSTSFEMSELMKSEADIYEYCHKYNFPEPVLDELTSVKPENTLPDLLFGFELLGSNAEEKQKTIEKQGRMAEVLMKAKDDIISGKNVRWLIKGSREFDKYFSSANIPGLEMIRDGAFAVLDDTQPISGSDIIFTDTALVLVTGKKFTGEGILYKNINLSDTSGELYLGRKYKYRNRSVDLAKLYRLISDLNGIIFEMGD